MPPKRKGESEQPRWTKRVIDIQEALENWEVKAVLERWFSARLHEAPAYSGGVLDAWPAVMVEGLSICRDEEQRIDSWRRHQENSHG